VAPPKKVAAFVKLQVPAGAANPAPPVGTGAGPHGVNIMAFCKTSIPARRTAGMIIPVEVTIYADRTFTFITKTPPPRCCSARKPHREGLGRA